MDNLELPRATENIEPKDSSPEAQSLEDATYDSGGYVERSQTIQEAESVESNFVTLIDGAIGPTGQTGGVREASQAPFKPSHLIKNVDPSTGQSSSEEGSPRSTDEGSPVYAGEEKDPTGVGAFNQRPALGTTDEGLPDYQNEHAEPDVPARVAWDADEEGGAGTSAGNLGGVGKQGASDHKDLDPYNIDHELPEAKIKALGQGPQGLIQGNVAHGGLVGGNLPGSGSPLGPGGSHSSGGGPPVGNYGSGAVGQGKTTWKSTHEKDGKVSEQEGSTSSSCESVKDSAKSIAERESGKGGSGSTTINCADGNTTYKVKYNPDGWSVTKTYQKSYTLEGGTPMPYTGSGGGHSTETPYGPKTGPDREASLLRMLAGGKTDQKMYVGMGSSGSTTFSPSSGGEEDDSGKFYGGLYGSAYRPNNPDNPDYYTPNILAEALKAK